MPASGRARPVAVSSHLPPIGGHKCVLALAGQEPNSCPAHFSQFVRQLAASHDTLMLRGRSLPSPELPRHPASGEVH
jgi:hypothetical protein